MTLPIAAQELLHTFSTASSWEQTMRLLMQAATTLAPLTATELTEVNRIHGCESQVWLVATLQVDHCWYFRAYSEARIVSGLLAVLLARINGLTSNEISQVELFDWFKQLKLTKQLSSSRRDGLTAIWQRITTIISA